MPFEPGHEPTGGRPKGSKNKLSLKVKDAMEEAFEGVGGADYLKKLAWTDKAVFCALLGKLLPKDLELSGKDGEPIVIQVITGVPKKPENDADSGS